MERKCRGGHACCRLRLHQFCKRLYPVIEENEICLDIFLDSARLFVSLCHRGCAHCGRGGSPSIGDGAFETRFRGMRFVNSSQRALFRHPNEAFLYDLDGTLTGTRVVENYTLGGKVRGSSLVGTSSILPAVCTPTSMALGGTGGSVCTGVIFRRFWFKITSPTLWVGKALCVRTPKNGSLDRCQSLLARCNCLPYLKMGWMGNVFLAAEGQRYSLQVTCQIGRAHV